MYLGLQSIACLVCHDRLAEISPCCLSPVPRICPPTIPISSAPDGESQLEPPTKLSRVRKTLAYWIWSLIPSHQGEFRHTCAGGGGGCITIDIQHKEISWTGRLDCFVNHWGYTVVRRHTKFDRIDYNWLTVTTAIKVRLRYGWDLWRSSINNSTHLGAVSIVENYCLRAIVYDLAK